MLESAGCSEPKIRVQQFVKNAEKAFSINMYV